MVFFLKVTDAKAKRLQSVIYLFFFYLQKTETKTVTTDNIEETKQNLTKLVQETYVKDESDEANKNKANDDKTKVKCK